MSAAVPTRSRIAAWEQTAGGLSAAARDWRAGADQLEQCAAAYAGQIAAPGGTHWGGPGADAAVAAAHADRGTVDRGADRARRLAEVADRGAEALRWGRQLALTAIAEAEQNGFAVAEDLSVTDELGCDNPAEYPGRLRAARAYRRHIVHCAARLQSEDDDVATQLDTGAAELAHLAQFAWGGTPAKPDAVAALPPADTGPEDVQRWWESLTWHHKARLIAEHPPELGNLNGIPAEVRGKVNQAVLDDDIGKVEDPGIHRPSTTDITRYRNAKKTSAGLEYGRGAHRPVTLWAYDPLAFNGQGRAAIAFGDPDHAPNTAVIVPGTGNSVAQGWMADHDDAINVFDRSALAAPNRPTAVIAWMGYDAPDGALDRRLTEPWLARRGGELLARDVNGLWVTHQGAGQHLTVVGHSYGATTVADAFARGHLRASDAILLGCPGTDLARHASDFHLGAGHVYVGSASTDPVSWIGQTGGVAGELLKSQLRVYGIPLPVDAGLGPDPAALGFGAIRFHAEAPGAEHLDWHDHSHYYLPGGQALAGITDIVTGGSERLAADGLLADGRRQPHIGAPSQIQLPGLPPIHLPHVDTRIPGTPEYIDPESAGHR